jgi:hypothetical protein
VAAAHIALIQTPPLPGFFKRTIATVLLNVVHELLLVGLLLFIKQCLQGKQNADALLHFQNADALGVCMTTTAAGDSVVILDTNGTRTI